MPRLWDDTLESHRQHLHQAILDTTARLIHEKGLNGVTMQDIARETGIGRATLYKHFKDLAAILSRWHQQHLEQHLQHLQQTLSTPGTPLEHLKQILTLFAEQAHHHPQTELSHLLHQQPHALEAQQHLLHTLTHLIEVAQQQHQVREDTPAGELALFCLHSLTAATRMPEASLDRLVQLILRALKN
ncbi:TetR/AcrR family transcriptional regulator [Deinococcus cellulosilyticus]|uniref:HTH tetR-type domain-containing protein n=1 Tax=Deinococcus cellulosilyticus (strain DSM 18568 / NBRC 106333 / KACC 11606 / 5516J-15) TaxID=1223518 RepID=A0A511NAE2_DEIC1|nr:TetR/AcrR family transcriptional regulator [Deinococcus cellulosilyticus]GEM49537.1 hypothetical protein DC3_51720 [Deinococcus cellulosilyticus NBRC 106333 = KACC 11606]